MKNQKGFAHIILILIVVVAAIGGIYYFVFSKNKDEEVLGPIGKYVITTNPSTPNTMADWKTYTNTKYGFELSYPNNLIITDYGETGAMLGDIVNIRIGDRPSNPEFLSMNFEDYVKIAGPQEIQNYEKLNSVTEIKTGSGMTGYKTKWKVIPLGGINNRTESTITFFRLKGDQYYSKHAEVSLYSDDEVMYDQILSTFKFLDSNSESNLNLYSNKELGFSLNYPKTFSVGQDGWSRIGDNPKGNWILELNAENPKINLNLDVRVNPVTAGGKPILKVEDAIQGVSYSKTTMDGRPALTFTTSGIGGMNNKSVYALDGNTLYQLIEYDWEARDADWSNLNQILSTFKFTNK